MVDGALVLWESFAINHYLARRYGATDRRCCDSERDFDRALQWSIWVVSELTGDKPCCHAGPLRTT